VRPAPVGLPRKIDIELARAGVLEERPVDGEKNDERGGDVHRDAEDAFQRHVHVADEARNLVALVRPGRRQVRAEEGVKQEADGDHRHDPAGGAAHRLQHQHDQRDAEEDVPIVRGDRAVEEIVALADEPGTDGNAEQRERPVPRHHAVTEAPRDGEYEERQEEHECHVRRAQHLRAHDLVGGVEVEQRHHHRGQGDERRHGAGELVLDALFLLDHLLGPLQRLFADLGGRLMDAGDFFAHKRFGVRS
jgi:hypothetical protein